jgi:hypothetical protein
VPFKQKIFSGKSLMSRVLSAMADESSFGPVWKFGVQV